METPVSLLERLRGPTDEDAWRRLDDIYRPLICRWVLRDSRLSDDAEDVVQEVMHVLVRELPGFERQRNGSFRRWLRTITVHRVLGQHRARHYRPQGLGAPLDECPLAQLADPNSELSRLWDEEHDRHVLRQLLEQVTPLFEATTIAAFRSVVFDEQRPIDAAAVLGVSVNSILLAKSKVLRQLRLEARGLID